MNASEPGQAGSGHSQLALPDNPGRAPGPQASLPQVPDHELLRPIGTGSYGEVWLARNVVSTLRAVKIVRRSTFERDDHFEREFKGIQKFEPLSRSHEGLVDILQIGRNDEAGCFYYLMELADDVNAPVAADVRRLNSSTGTRVSPPAAASKAQGAPENSSRSIHAVSAAAGDSRAPQSEPPHVGCYEPRTLRAEQQLHGRLPVPDCVRIGVTLASALAHLHRHGLVHRDVKPSNIIFVGGVPKLADIGLVAETSEAKSFVGTLGFIPPEGPGTPQADLYSLGKVLYEISTGRDRQDFPQLPADLLRGSAALPLPATLAHRMGEGLGVRATGVERAGVRADQSRSSRREEAQISQSEIGNRKSEMDQSLLTSAATNREAVTGEPRALPDADETEALIELNEVLLKACHKDLRQRYASAEAMLVDLELLQRGKSVQRRRTMQRRLALGTRVGLAAAGVGTLLCVLPWVKFESPGAKRPQPGDFASRPSLRKRTPASEEAYRLYEKGRFHFEKLTGEDLKKAVEYLNQAIQIDPDFAPAYATLFEIFAWDLDFSPGSYAKMKKVAKRLMEIDDTLPEARHAWGWVKFMEMDWAGAEEEAKRAITLNPNYATAHSYLGFYLCLQRRIDEAHAQMSRALELEPASRISTTVSGYPFYAARDYDRAIVQFRKALDLDANFFFARWWVGRTYEAKGDYIAAIAEFEKNALVAGEDRDRAKAKYDALRDAFATGGERGYWQKRLETGWSEPRGNTYPNSPYYLAEMHARLGNKERALDSLEKAYEVGDTIHWLKFDPYWDNLREEARFKALLRQVGLEK